AEVGDGAQAAEDAHVGDVEAGRHQNPEDGRPERETSGTGWRRRHARGNRGGHDIFSLPALSAAATFSRRCVIQYTPPSRTAPAETTSGTRESARQVRSGSGSCGSFVFRPSCSKGTAERKSTEVPPASSMP